MKKIYLDSIYKAPTDKPVLIVVDLRVALYAMLGRYVKVRQAVKAEEFWRYYLNAIPSIIHSSLEKANCRIAVVDDWRDGDNYNYWRESWLCENAQGSAVYKGNRGTKSESDRPDGYNELLKACHDYCEQAHIPLFRQSGFEADDFAGSFYRIANGNWQTILVSIDNDWGQLVNDKLDIIQYINGIFKVPISKLRSEYEIYQYYEQRMDIIMTDTYDIVDYKVEFGDAGDNIECGTPREVIDLRNAPVKPTPIDKSIIFNYAPCQQSARQALTEIARAEWTLN